MLRRLPIALLLTGCGLVLDLSPPDPGPGLDAGTGECQPGRTRRVACGECASEQQVCDANGAWVGEGCEPVGICSPGDEALTTDGCQPGSARRASCTDACELTGGDCEPLADRPFVVVPDDAPPIPSPLPLRFQTHVAIADLYLLLDESPSLVDELSELADGLPMRLAARGCDVSATSCRFSDECSGGQVCSRLLGQCVESPATTGCVASFWSGAGVYSTSGQHLLDLQDDPSETAATIRDIVSVGGGVEELNEAVLNVAEPAVGFTVGCSGPGPVAIGCPSYRPEARRLLLVMTDEGTSELAPTASDVGGALRRQGITFIGVSADGDRAYDSLAAIAQASGSLRSDGSPLVYEPAPGEIATVVDRALQDVLTTRPQAVSVQVTDIDDGDGVDAAGFVDRIEVGAGAGCVDGPTSDTDGDGADDTLDAVLPGQTACFELHARRHPSVSSGDAPRVFRARVDALGDGVLVDRVVVSFVVP